MDKAQETDDAAHEAADTLPDGADEAPDDAFEVELDGQVHSLPGALKGAFLRQADYTRKTQELAEHRRALEADRQALAAHAQDLANGREDRLRLAALDHQLAELQGVDWKAYAAQDPHGAQALWARFQAMAEAREQLAQAVAHAQERDHLHAARNHAQKMADTGQALRREIDGWSPEVAAKLVDYAQAFGIRPDELAQTADARLWKLLHKGWRADAAGQGAASGAAVAVRPAVTLAGSGAGAGGVRDELGTKEWMRRRNDQLARAR
ncbi:MAG: hypothetical protein JF588_03695 [Caulobacterales bacterium]|nr:hypothetical protein [Caulobacterales bacterium]